MKKKFLTILLVAALSVSSIITSDMVSAQAAGANISNIMSVKSSDTTQTAFHAPTYYTHANGKVLYKGSLLFSYAEATNSNRSKKASPVSAQKKQKVESILSTAFDTFQTQCDFSSLHISVSAFNTLLSDFVSQHPRYFYVNQYISYYYNGANQITTVHFSYNCTKSESVKMLSKYNDTISSILAGVDPLWSDLEKALYLNDYLATHCKYDSSLSKFSAYDCLVEKTAVCQGYALAYMELLTDVGIPCQVVTSKSLNHAWNMMCINGKYYYNDVTWNDPSPDKEGYVDHAYFLKSENSYRSKGHLNKDDWHIHDDWNLHDASDTSYDTYCWDNIHTAFHPIQGKWYNYEGTDRIQQFTYSNGQFIPSKTLITIQDTWYLPNMPEFPWEEKLIGFAAYGSLLYYSTADKIYQFDPVTETSTLVYELSSAEKSSIAMCGLFIDDSGKLYYLSTTDIVNTKKNFVLQLASSENNNAPTNTCYQICFDGNGAGNGVMDTMHDCLFDRTYTLTANTFTRTGYTFTGWNTKADGTGTAYTDGACVTGLSAKNYSSITLYAQWTKKTASNPSNPSNTTQPVIRLSAKKLTIKKGKTATLRLYNNTKKTTWSILSGKKYIALSNRSNAGITIKACKKGTAKVQATVSGKKYTCTIRVK